MKNSVYICLGGNMGDRDFYIKSALHEVEKNIGEVIKISSLYETSAWGSSNQQAYLNQCVLIHTILQVQEVMDALCAIEKRLGRVRDTNNQYAARTIDLDILFYNDHIIDTISLQIPHPRLHLRKFVLVPLNEIAPHDIHPLFSLSVNQLLQQCKDDLEVMLYQSIQYVH